MKRKLKKDDQVVVIAGKDKGKTGTISRVLPTEGRVVVEGINLVKRHTRASATGNGGIVEQAASLHISNVALADPKSGKPTRVGFETRDGKKTRIARASGDAI